MADDLQTKAGELVKKALTIGMGAVFMTEEGIKSLMGDMKLPKELLGGILENANKAKSEFFQNMSADLVNKVVDRVDPKELIDEIIQNNEIEFTIKVNFKKK